MLQAYLIHVRKLEKDFDALELQHVPRELNSAADDPTCHRHTKIPSMPFSGIQGIGENFNGIQGINSRE